MNRALTNDVRELLNRYHDLIELKNQPRTMGAPPTAGWASRFNAARRLECQLRRSPAALTALLGHDDVPVNTQAFLVSLAFNLDVSEAERKAWQHEVKRWLALRPRLDARVAALIDYYAPTLIGAASPA